MTKWLASVQSLQEAQQLSPILPDILDMKDPAQGALGALPVPVVRKIVSFINKRCLCSATIGDLPMQPTQIITQLSAMADSQVDILKIGLFADPHLPACIEALHSTVHELSQPVIGVLFADAMPEHTVIPLLAHAGFAGVMVDTAYKNGQGLLDHWSQGQLKAFIHTAKDHNLLCGLAGALRYDDIAILKPLGSDYLGFRSALCRHHQRTTAINITLAQKIHHAIHA